MMVRQMLDGSDVVEGDRQGGETVRSDCRLERDGEYEFAQPGLYRDLPGRYHADETTIGAPDDVTVLCLEPSIAIQNPKKNLRIDEKIHCSISPSKARWISSGKGASKSSAIQIFPFNAPKMTGDFLLASATSRARGLPALAMMISSPAAARSTSRERFGFASLKLSSSILRTFSTT